MGRDRERSPRRRETSEERAERHRRRRGKEHGRESEREKRQRRSRHDSERRELHRHNRSSHERRRSSSDDRRRSPKERHRMKRSKSPERNEEPSKDKRQKLEPSGARTNEKELKKADLSADITPEDVQLMQAMGIPFGFETTQGKHVQDEESNSGAVRAKSLRQARQYMNRKGGFNRPLPPERTGQKVVRD